MSTGRWRYLGGGVYVGIPDDDAARRYEDGDDMWPVEAYWEDDHSELYSRRACVEFVVNGDMGGGGE